LNEGALFFAGVDHPPPSLSSLYFVLDMPSSFAISQSVPKKKKLTLTIVWLGPDSNRLFLLEMLQDFTMRSRCELSTTEPFFPSIEPQYTKQFLGLKYKNKSQ
jgi:hypothetical protein